MLQKDAAALAQALGSKQKCVWLAGVLPMDPPSGMGPNEG